MADTEPLKTLETFVFELAHEDPVDSGNPGCMKERLWLWLVALTVFAGVQFHPRMAMILLLKAAYETQTICCWVKKRSFESFYVNHEQMISETYMNHFAKNKKPEKIGKSRCTANWKILMAFLKEVIRNLAVFSKYSMSYV